jgi:DNA-binding NarL/FixJ family response regulator
MTIKVVIAEDHHLVRQGIRALLENEKEFSVIGEATNGKEAMDLARKLVPDVLVMDINMPRMDGIQAVERIQEMNLKTQVIILSMYSDESLIKKAYKKGVKGYLLKRSITEDLLEAIHAASRREIYISEDIATTIDVDTIRLIQDTHELNPFDTLTQREKEVFKMVAEGMTNNGIAYELGISAKTVEKHRASLMEKLKIEDMAGLVREAIRYGLVFIEG